MEESYSDVIERIKKKYPDFREAAEIECLDLIMRKEFAQEILAGNKTVELRAGSDHYGRRLMDLEVFKFISDHADDPDVRDCVYSVKKVKTIHFHNYNNSWFLDVECVHNDVTTVAMENVLPIHQEFGCQELVDMAKDFENVPNEEKPNFFYFAIGKILKTDLE